MARFLAFLVLLVPGIMAAAGIKFMRDTLFADLLAPFPALWLQFITGALLLTVSLWFFAGFLLHRDRKRGKVQKRFVK